VESQSAASSKPSEDEHTKAKRAEDLWSGG
jgi:hypothetical protein